MTFDYRSCSAFGLAGSAWLTEVIDWDITTGIAWWLCLWHRVKLVWRSTGSVIGPILFICYMVDVFDIVVLHGLHRHFHWCFPTTVTHDGSLRVAQCVTHVDRWMTLNTPKMKADKTSWSGLSLGSSSPSSLRVDFSWLSQS